MINKETIDELKKSHSEIFAAKMAVLKDEQVVASVILAQIEQDRLNPPENAAKASVRNALQVVITHTERAELAKEELDKVIQSVREKFPEIDLGEVDFVLLPSDGEGSAEIIQGLREQLSAGALQKEQLLAEMDRATLSIVDLQTELKAAQSSATEAKAAVAGYEASLKGSQDLLKKIGECGSIKDVRELLKSADPQTTAETKAG